VPLRSSQPVPQRQEPQGKPLRPL